MTTSALIFQRFACKKGGKKNKKCVCVCVCVNVEAPSIFNADLQLPQFWLAYLAEPKDSGKMHSNARQRWLNNDPEVVE